MKKSAKNRIIIWSIVSVVLVTVLVWSIFAVSFYQDSVNLQFFDSKISLSNFDDFQAGNADFDAEDVSSIEANWISGKVEILYSDTDKITITDSSTDSDDIMYWNLDNSGNLEIYANEFEFRLISFGNNDSPKNLTITVPKDKHFSDFDINSASADIYADGINANEIDIDTVSGTTEIKELKCSDANLNNASGDINILCTQVNEFDINTISGNVSISGNYDDLYVSSVSGKVTADAENENVQIGVETVSGEIEVGLNKDFSGFIAEYDKVSGNFESDFVGTSHDDSFVYGNASASFNFDTVSGNIRIVKK